MAFIIEYLEDREALSKLGVDDYKTDFLRIYNSSNDIWDDFGAGNKLIFIDRERDLWLLFLGHQYSKDRDRAWDRSDGNPTEDIFLFNYKGNIVEILLRVAKENTSFQLERPFNTIYEFVEMRPNAFDDIDEMGLKKLICEALATPDRENMHEFRGVTYAYVPTLTTTKCKLNEER